MLKKMLIAFAVVAVGLGVFSQADKIQDACSYICCEHDGSGWDN